MKKKIANLFSPVFAFMKKHSLGTCVIALLITALVVTFACKDLSEQAPSDKDTVSEILTTTTSEETDSKVANTSGTETTESTQKEASSQEDVGSESVASKVEEEKEVASNKETTSKKEETATKDVSEKETVSKPVDTHKHSYTKKVVKATCEKGGYTKYTCSCGHSYKDDKTDMLGHLYTDWKVTKKATTKSTGLKECKCDKCGGATITEVIPKKKTSSNIDSKVEIGTAKFTGFPQYTLDKIKLIDKRTWGEAPTITVINGNDMHVTYYNKKGKKVEFVAEQPVTDNTTNLFDILDDGTYVNSYVGSYS